MAEPTESDPGLPVDGLNSRRRGTLTALFDRPDRPDIPWRDIEALFEALGGTVSQGRGSRVRVFLNGRVGNFHEPHPERVTDKGAVVSVRKFLIEVGLIP